MSARRVLVALIPALLLGACASPAERAAQRNIAQINTQLGVNYAREGQYDRAIEKLQAAVAARNDYAPAHSALAVIYQSRGESDAAEKEYRRALALDGSDPTVKNNFGVFLCERGKNDEARAYFMDVVNDVRYPAPQEVWTNAGICVKKKDPKLAEHDFREALRIKPDYRDALAQMALLSFDQQDFLRTRAFLQRYDLKQSATPELLGVAARTEYALGNREGALEFARRVVQEFPASKEAELFADWQP
ncbi:type IV pilus biogenesis/stability protein PilW [Solimonas terrae]|uniref:Type IV pilus biogenesis/stability protein PilW n=1 Tax=Solimonas terrae TaxID=1396819 RepID=A0A6M2BRA7_9GAMM|nr:type IV pilus biogenesis/stability protein PilW [Solimonas terrae]NGY04547.1 type IV pilus biogenesis/stability protein PilW [Solimonas terrae]